MRKISKLTLLTALLVLAMSVSALAVKYQSAEWEFGDEKNLGSCLLLEYGADGEFPDEGILMPFFKINEGDKEARTRLLHILLDPTSRRKEIDTTFGVRLPVNSRRILPSLTTTSRWLYVEGLDYEFGPASLALNSPGCSHSWLAAPGNYNHMTVLGQMTSG